MTDLPGQPQVTFKHYASYFNLRPLQQKALISSTLSQQKALVEGHGEVGLSERRSRKERSKRRKSSSEEIARIVREQDRSEDFRVLQLIWEFFIF